MLCFFLSSFLCFLTVFSFNRTLFIVLDSFHFSVRTFFCSFRYYVLFFLLFVAIFPTVKCFLSAFFPPLYSFTFTFLFTLSWIPFVVCSSVISLPSFCSFLLSFCLSFLLFASVRPLVCIFSQLPNSNCTHQLRGVAIFNYLSPQSGPTLRFEPTNAVVTYWKSSVYRSSSL